MRLSQVNLFVLSLCFMADKTLRVANGQADKATDPPSTKTETTTAVPPTTPAVTTKKADETTTPSTKTETTTAAPSTKTETTTSLSTTTETELMECRKLKLEGLSHPYSPLETVEIKCIHTCNTTKLKCPILKVPVSVSLVGSSVNRTERSEYNRSCSVTVFLHLLDTNFAKKRLQIPVACEIHGVQPIEFDGGSMSDTFEDLNQFDMITFEKKLHDENCTYDVDCWDDKQECENGKCTCCPETPVYVKTNNQCFQASEYDQDCLFNEQCTHRDPNRMCMNKVCTCKIGARSELQDLCLSGSLALSILYRTWLLSVAISSISYFARRP